MLPLVAHRGYPSRFPENTLEGIEAALELGAQYVEFDLQLTADGVPVVCHDDNLKRTSGGINAPIMEMTLQQVQLIPVGEPERFGSRYQDVTVPSLAELVAFLEGWPRATAFVEIKKESAARFGVEAFVAKVMAVLQPVLANCVLISDVEEVVSCAKAQGAFRTGWVMHEWNEHAHGIAQDLVPDFLFCNHTRIPRTDSPLWPGPWEWALYETSEVAVARELLRLGSDLVETNAIGEIIEQMGEGEPLE